MRESAHRPTGTSALKRVYKGFGASTLAHAIAAAQVIVLVPFFLRAWGPDGYGRWVTLVALVQYLSLLGLGGQNYVGNLLAMEHARGNEEAFRRKLSAAVSLFLFIGLGAFIALVFLLLALQNVPLPGLGRPLERWEAWVVAILAFNLVLISLPGGIWVTVYRAAGVFARGAMVGNVVRSLGLIALIGLLYAPVTPVVYAAGMSGIGVLLVLAIVWDTRRCIPGCRSVRISLTEARRGWAYLGGGAIDFWLISVAQSINQQGVVLILAASVSPAVVAVYATHRALSNISAYAGILVEGPLIPELSFLWARQRLSELCKTTFIAMKTVLLLTGATAALLWLSAPIIFPLWTGSHIRADPLLLGILLVQGVLQAGWMTSSWSRVAANHHRPLAFWSIANACTTLVLAAWLVRGFGAIGIASASLLGDLMCGFAIFPVLASSFMKVPVTRVYGQIGSTALALIPIGGIAMVMSVVLKGWWSVAAFLFLGLLLTYPMLRLVFGGDDTNKGIEMLRVASGWRAG